MGIHTSGLNAEIVDLADFRFRRRVERDIKTLSSFLHTGPDLFSFYWNKLPDMVHLTMANAFNTLAMFQPAMPKKLSMTFDWIDQETGLDDFCRHYIRGGEITLSRYHGGPDLRGAFSGRDDGWRTFSMTVSDDCKLVTFFHGDRAKQNGIVLEWSMGDDGDYFSTAFYERRDGKKAGEIEMDEDTIGGFLHEITPAMGRQHRQFATRRHGMRLV